MGSRISGRQFADAGCMYFAFYFHAGALSMRTARLASIHSSDLT
jgi:hypothetical protein